MHRYRLEFDPKMPLDDQDRLTAMSDSYERTRTKDTDPYPITSPREDYYGRRGKELDRLRAAGYEDDLEEKTIVKEYENYRNLLKKGKDKSKRLKLPLEYEVGDEVSFKMDDRFGEFLKGIITKVNNSAEGELYYNIDLGEEGTAGHIPHKNIFPIDHIFPENQIEKSFERKGVVESDELKEHRALLRELQIKGKGKRLGLGLGLDGRRRRRIKRTSKKKSADGRRKKSGKKSGKKKSGKKRSDGGRKRSKSRRKSKSKSKSKSRRRKY